jgi:hypothetical protein
VTPRIREIEVVDHADAWRAAGFAVGGDGTVVIGATTVRLVAHAGAAAARAATGDGTGAGDGGDGTGGGDDGPGRRPGIAGWTLAGLSAPPPGGGLDGLPTSAVDDDPLDPGAAPRASGPADGSDITPVGAADAHDDARPHDAGSTHPNGATHVDHVVVFTPDLDRTTAALEAAGIVARRTRATGAGPDGVARLQRFFRLGEVIVELVGPADPQAHPAPDRPARFWGLAHAVADLDATAQVVGEHLSETRPAVQPGRRIASLRRSAGSSVPTAFLAPEPVDRGNGPGDH